MVFLTHKVGGYNFEKKEDRHLQKLVSHFCEIVNIASYKLYVNNTSHFVPVLFHL